MSIDDLKKVTDEIRRRRDEYKKERDELKRLLKLCVKDLYSPSGKFKKNTARAIVKYIHQPSEQGENWL